MNTEKRSILFRLLGLKRRPGKRIPIGLTKWGVFLSFMFGNQRVLKEFGFGLAAAVLLDAIVVRCVLLPAVLELLGPITWRLPRSLDTRLPHIHIEGTRARSLMASFHSASDFARIMRRNCSPARNSPSPAVFTM